MPTILLVILVRLAVMVVGAVANRGRASKPKPLCSECAFAHIQFGACGRRVISCTFGGGVRPMKLEVLYCTDYRSRSAPPRAAIGFVRSIGTAS